MKNFDEQLLRLKQGVKLTEDQAVAALLGMKKEALFQRKKRDSFPADKVWALATQRPDLQLDVNYILTGIEASTQARLDAMGKHMEAASDAGLSIEEVRASMDASDPGNISNIVVLLRKCRHKERAAVHDMLKTIVDLQDMVLALQPKAARGGGYE